MDARTLIASAVQNGWESVFEVFDRMALELEAEKQAPFLDLFFSECLQMVNDTTPTAVIWTIAVKWHSKRNLSTVGYNLELDTETGLYPFLTLLRKKLSRALEVHSMPMENIGDFARPIILLWQAVFLPSYSILNQIPEPENPNYFPISPFSEADSPDYYLWLMRMSLYYPFDADQFMVDVEKLLTARIPSYIKVILAMWLVNVPRYNSTQYQRQKVLYYLPMIFRVTRSTATWMDPFFHLLAEWLMVALFRLAYIHEDNSTITGYFGDFISNQMQRLLPQIANERKKNTNELTKQRKIRIGYVSTRFVANAVTFYMANRILQHDRNTFEIIIFIIGSQHDGMTDVLEKNCFRLIRMENRLDYLNNAKVIRDCDLDILIYADIGMEIPTYLLAGLRLAPLQAALLGHASPTGLPTMDYFFSSDVEPENAQLHYREKLLRMPNVGAAQIMPPGLRNHSNQSISRQILGIPETAFVFISCANGMKHVPERDYIWVEILRKIPHAWILIKPFSPGDYDRKMVERIVQAGKLAGASDRIRFINGCDSHNEVFSLLSLANAQLDTYPFNGWTTTIEAFCLALPTITQEGNAYRSRLGAGFLRAMGVTEGIAANEEDYLGWAIKFANDPQLCQWVKNRIKATRKNLLFDNTTLQMEYEKALIEMVRKQGGVCQCV